ncbi:AMP-binding protein [Primorskyibacter aestuariivivens]|uniref:AMP-binding protein n=1 Tax=Primorskyibacter aestuariivivens TaxID=1888912 RepID=UPI00230180FD|nr:AMP-binding protein [Primorskyibacter aestuariivivens]MDA7430606.1 AMP-binding protein [Primorskyibacter aestuariivivens]
MKNELFYNLVGRHSSRDETFLREADGTVWSYKRFIQLTNQTANALQSMGIKPGQRVAVQVDKSPAALAIYTACIQSGLVFLPLNTAYTASEVEFFLEDSGARLFICRPDLRDQFRRNLGGTGVCVETLSADGTGLFADRVANQSLVGPVCARNKRDLAVILYTSGTTGRSKGAMLTHENLLTNASTLAKLWKITDQDTLLHALPIFHIHGLFVAVNTVLVAGASMEYLPKFNLDDVFAALPKSTLFMGVPTFYTRLLQDERLSAESTDHMRLFVSGSAPLLADTFDRFQQRTGHIILERYGMTETNMIASNPYDGERRKGTVGLPLPGVEVQIVRDEDGQVCAANEVGQIHVRGPNVCAGYWKLEEKTKAEFTSNGYFRTGDLGCLDADGYLKLTGRAKDLIISGGYNIYPKEIEAVLDGCRGVKESAVIGIPDPDFGERVLAVIVEDETETFDEESTRAVISSGLAKFKHPKLYKTVSELPRNSMGKVQKKDLRTQFAQSDARLN